MVRAVLLALGIATFASPALVRAQPVEAAAALEAGLRIERELLARDLNELGQARTAERRERGRVDAAASRMDALLGGEALAVGPLEDLERELAAARQAERAAAERLDRLRERIGERLRRITALEEELKGPGEARRADLVTGRWRVRILPQEQSGVFELRLAGAVVTGSYELDGGSRGSLRGTFVGSNLRLERIDAQRGFDSVFLGVVDAAGRIAGSWRANELAVGEPTRGDWSAVKTTAE